MGCESPLQINKSIQFHPTTPEKSTPYPPNPSLVQRMLNDTCFKCKQQGHWSMYCPNNNNNHSPVLSSNKQIHCRCGHGFCDVKISNSERNKGRLYFACPIKRGAPCGTFVKWCDDERDLEPSLVKYPKCKCGAGVCRREMEGAKYYFTCPVKQNFGSCGYRALEVELLNNASTDKLVNSTSIGDNLTNGFAEGSDLLLTTKRTRITDNYENPSTVAVSEIPEGRSGGSPIYEANSQPVGFPEIEFKDDQQLINLASWEAIEDKVSPSSCFSTPSRISCRQSLFPRDIFSADATFEQQNNQKRKREEEEEEEEEMGCEPPQQITNIPHSPSPHFQFHPTTPEKSTPYPPNPNIVKRMQESICYKCGQQGHWAKYCPLKTPNKNNNHSPVLSSDKQIWCGCGHGVCLLKTAHTPNNYGREFFTCPIRLGKPCGTFKWCDGTIHESDFQRPLFKYPVCQCGAGVCGKVMEGGKSYFICPIKQGHGSCGYHVSEDELLNNASIDEPVDDTSIVPYRQSKHRSLNEHIEGDQVDTAGNDLTNDFAEGSVLLSTTKRMRITDGSENPSPVAVSEIPKGKSRGSPIEEVNSQPDGFPDIEFEGDLESIASLMANEAEASLTSRFSTPLKISCRQNVFQGDIISADASFGMFPSFDPMDVPEQASTLHSQSECNDLVIKSPNQCTQLSADVISPNRSPGSEKLKERKQREAVIFMQQGLLNDLEGFDFHQHESMRDTAEAAFSVLNCLGFGYKQFSDYVWEFINHAKSMTEIDKSMENSPTLEEHSKFLEEEKVRLANIRDDCVKIETLLAVSDEIRNLLSEEVANLLAVLLKKQKELKSCELEKMKEETRLGDMKRRMSVVDLIVKEKAQQAEAARKKIVERDTTQVAARTALEKAKRALEK